MDGSEEIFDKLKAGEAIAYVDGSFSNETGEYGSGVVLFYDNEVYEFTDKGSNAEAATMRNVSGEVMAAMISMREARKLGAKKLIIYHDYQGISDWCTGAWKTKKEGTKVYKQYYLDMSKALDISFIKVEGHSGDTWNDRADTLARSAIGK